MSDKSAHEIVLLVTIHEKPFLNKNMFSLTLGPPPKAGG